MQNMKLNADEEHTLTCALYTASAKYRECAKEVGASDMNDEAKKRLVGAFNKQADDAFALAEKLED